MKTKKLKKMGMWKFPDKPTVYFDVDQTLVWWGSPKNEEEERSSVVVTVPAHRYSYLMSGDPIDDECEYESLEYHQRVVPIKEHVEHLKEHKRRQHVVVVWSAGGSEWAAAVVKALGLEEYVDLCICKPHWHVDDLPASEFMGQRVYLVKETDRD